MTTNVADLSITASSATTTRTFAARWADVINVKDYGAVGDGSHDDQPNIQAAFNAAFGSSAAPHNNTTYFQNRPVFFPAGQYNVSLPLSLTEVEGGHIFGAGSRQTVIHYTGSSAPQADSLTSLLQVNSMAYSNFEGITFDMLDLGVTGVSFRLHFAAGHQAGNANTFRDCAFINGTIGCLLVYNGGGGSPGTGSENTFINCRWKDNFWAGLQTLDSNALNNTVVGGSFENCGRPSRAALWSVTGSIPNIIGVDFIDNTGFDIISSDGGCLYVQGCVSNSNNFLSAKSPSFITNVYHTAASSGSFANFQVGTKIVAENCHSIKGEITTSATTSTIYLKGCQFDSSTYISGFTGNIGENI